MDFGRRALSALGKVGITLGVLVAFLFGMLGTVYLSLRTSEVKVPDIVGKDRFTAESMLDDAGLKIRIRGTRPSADKPDSVLSQLPEAGQVVKAGIPVAIEVSRAPKEGESVRSSTEKPSEESAKPAENSNTNQSTPATNQNQNQNQNKPPKNKNTNKNANNTNNKNANNSNNANRNANANRNTNNQNANATRNANNRNANTTPNANRTTNNSNSNKRPAVITRPPSNPGANRVTP